MSDTGKHSLFEGDKDFVNDDHIYAFAKALVWEETEEINDETPMSPLAPQTNNLSDEAELIDDVNVDQAGILQSSPSNNSKPDLITSKSDWYPVIDSKKGRNNTQNSNNRKRKTYSKRSKFKKATKKLSNEFRSSASYTLLRWPFLIIILMWIITLAALYTIVRAYVALLEYTFTWVGERRRLRDRLRNSKSYEEWVENALALDKYLNLDKWSVNPKFSYYDSNTIKLTISKLRVLRSENNDYDLMVLLQGCLKKNFAGIENKQLYSHRYYGTKNLVEEYINEVVASINKVIDSPKIDFDAKRKFFRVVSKNYGKSALCLSGGACFAYTHFGVVKALLDHNLLPSIMSGTSGGGLIASLACTRTDEELKKLLVPQLARKITACEDPWYVWIPRWWKTGARFDSVDWARKSNFFTRGSTTFAEAFKRTGRILNISTIPADPHSPVILCTVGRPVATSRRKTHKERYASLRGGFVATALEQLFKLEIKKWLEIVKSLDLLPHFLEQDWLKRAIEKGRNLTKLSKNFNELSATPSAGIASSQEGIQFQTVDFKEDGDIDQNTDTSDEDAISYKKIEDFAPRKEFDYDDDDEDEEEGDEDYDDGEYSPFSNEDSDDNSGEEERNDGFIQSFFGKSDKPRRNTIT
ncbi:hypothetical protein QCA50_013957 [Cerrena zonata]|uniref:PNPLA domain-containing protein n=1 Tax=Cerrena zonata TaxID=2478898 RepID=A0AAW0FV34_9APHY